MCHIGSRKAKIQPQMAVSENADIFSIKVDSRLKTILIHTGVAPEMDFSSVFVTYIGHYISTLYITYIRHYISALFNLSFMFIHCHKR